MKEILANSISKVEYKIYIDGILTDATGDVRVTVMRGDVKVVDNQIASVPSGTDGTYQYVLPTIATVDSEVVSVTTTEGILEVSWTFTVNSNSLTVKEYYQVVTPYCLWEYFAPTEVGDTTPTYQQYLECERVARFIINSYCGQEFGQEYTTYAVEGHGTNALALPRKLQTLDSVTWTGNSVVRPGEVIGYEYPYAWEVVGSGWTIRQQPYPYKIDPVYNRTSRFIRNRTYNVAGLWGYSAVPTPVEEASKILTADFMCKEAKYRDKYLDNIKMGDWRIQFASGAFEGTGNAKADDLLSDYRLMPGLGLI
jgi:hypothetical protein